MIELYAQDLNLMVLDVWHLSEVNQAAKLALLRSTHRDRRVPVSADAQPAAAVMRMADDSWPSGCFTGLLLHAACLAQILTTRTNSSLPEIFS